MGCAARLKNFQHKDMLIRTPRSRKLEGAQTAARMKWYWGGALDRMKALIER